MMNKIIILLIGCIVLFTSCDKSFKASKPERLLTKEEMENIMYDIKLLNSARSKSFKKVKDNNVKNAEYIFYKYNVDSLTLRKNLDYYATHSFKDFKEMENNVKLRLMKAKELVKEQIRKEDSVNKPTQQKPKNLNENKKKVEHFKSDININQVNTSQKKEKKLQSH